MNLLDEIAETEAKLAQLKRQYAAAPCAEVGHRWKLLGGANASCCRDCSCSVAVHECEVCGDCDYGDPYRDAVKAECERRADEAAPAPGLGHGGGGVGLIPHFRNT